MIIRAILAAALCATTPLTAVAEMHSKTDISQSEARHAKISISNKELSGLTGEKLIAALKEATTIETNAGAIRYHTVLIKDGKVISVQTSEEAQLRKRPGRAKFTLPSDALPPENELEGFKLEKFAVPALNELLIEKRSEKPAIELTALLALKEVGAKDGIFIVTSWDDMAPGDTTRGLVGFGSWN